MRRSRFAMLGLLLAPAAACRLGFDSDDGASSGRADAAAGDAAPGGLTVTAAQTTPLLSIDGAGAGAGAVTFTSPTQAGQTVVVWVWLWAGGDTLVAPDAVTDSLGNVYSRAAAVELSAPQCSSGAAAAGMYVGHVGTGGGGHTVTFTASGAAPSPQMTMLATAYDGLPAATVRASLATPVAAAPSPMPLGTGALDVDAGGALLVAVATECAGYPGLVVWGTPAGWTARGTEPRTDGIAPGQAVDRVEPGPARVSADWTVMFTGSPAPAAAALAALR
ncbi:MAG: hypothetical protein KBG28_15270 [Kofleriaceae bacterium]|nr:hypothetical protein [Kofleriaceae bacterium]